MTCFRLKTGETLMSWCKKNNCCYPAIVNRIENGAPTVEAAIDGYMANQGKHKKYFYKGKSLYAYFGRHTSAYQITLERIWRGMSVEQAVEEVETFYNTKETTNDK